MVVVVVVVVVVVGGGAVVVSVVFSHRFGRPRARISLLRELLPVRQLHALLQAVEGRLRKPYNKQ
eukprot:4685537-Heterocapsa_arctica.AAC.1